MKKVLRHIGIHLFASMMLMCLGVASSQAQTINATQSDEIIIDNGTTGKADPNDRIRYKVTIKNTAGPSGTGTQLNIVPDPRTTFVPGSFRSSPLALPDAYTCTGNVGINVPAASGLKANDFDDAIASATITAGTFTTTGGGSIMIAADGSFMYTPPAGLTGGLTDTYTYTLNDSNGVGGGVPATDAGTVTFTLNNLIWFVDNTGGGSGGTGTLSNPFKTLADFNAGSATAGDVIYIEETGTNYTGGIVLQTNERLFGEGHNGGANLANVLPFSLAPNSNTLPNINGAQPVITNAGGNGVALASGNTLNGFTAGNSSGTAINGLNFGTLTVSNVIINTTGQALGLNNGTVAGSGFTSVTSSGGVNNINLNSLSGTLALGSGALSNAVGAAFFSNSAAATVTYSGTINKTGGGQLVSIALSTASASFTFSGALTHTSGVGSLDCILLSNNNTGSAFNFTGGVSITTASTGAAFSIIGAGTVTVSGAGNSVSVTAGTAFLDSGTGGSAIININANFTASTGRLIDIQNRAQNNNLTLSGNLSATSGTGILVNNNTAGTIAFTGSSKSLSTGANTAVTLSGNTGAIINFTNGGLVITTTSGTGFNATGGGTVSVSGTGNTINSTSGATALNVTNTTIGASNLNFGSISSIGGTASGIILNTTGTSGGLVVNGDGSNTTKGGNASGGTIANKDDSGTDDSGTIGTAIFLNNTSNVVIRRMQINDCKNFAIRGLSVGNFTLQYSTISGLNGDTNVGTEDCIGFGTSNPGGANGFLNGAVSTIDNCKISGAVEHQIEFYNQSNTFGVTVSNCDITDNTLALGGDGIQMEMQGTASATLSVQTCFFDDNKSQAVQAAANDNSFIDVTINNCTVIRSTQGNEGFVLSNGSNGDMTSHVTNNNLSGLGGVMIFVGQTPGNATASSNLITVVKGNTITHPTSATNHAIFIAPTSTVGQVSAANILVENNNITENSTSGVARAIEINTPDANTSPSFTASVIGNTISVGDNVAGVGGIQVAARQSSAGCFDIRNNTVTYPNGNPGVFGVRARQVNPATAQLEQGISSGTAAAVLAANNPGSTTEALGTITVVGNNTCQAPPN